MLCYELAYVKFIRIANFHSENADESILKNMDKYITPIIYVYDTERQMNNTGWEQLSLIFLYTIIITWLDHDK